MCLDDMYRGSTYFESTKMENCGLRYVFFLDFLLEYYYDTETTTKGTINRVLLINSE